MDTGFIIIGRTPSEEAGITIEGNDKWLILMHKAVQHQKALSKDTKILS